jgi:hypothetical protein
MRISTSTLLGLAAVVACQHCEPSPGSAALSPDSAAVGQAAPSAVASGPSTATVSMGPADAATRDARPTPTGDAGSASALSPGDGGAIDAPTPTAVSLPQKPAEPQMKAMADYLYKDTEYRRFVCGDDPCSIGAFRNQLDARIFVLRDAPRVEGYFVDPQDRSATNYFTGVFTFDGRQLAPQFIYFGASTVVDAHPDRSGFRPIRGHSRQGPTSWEDDVYAWDGTRYVRVKATMGEEPLPDD